MGKKTCQLQYGFIASCGGNSADLCGNMLWDLFGREEEINFQSVSIVTIIISLLNALALGFLVIIPLVISLVIIIFFVVQELFILL